MLRREEALQKLYQARFSQAERYRGAVWRIICRRVFSRYVPKSSKVLDLGAGWGEFITNIEADRKYAMDLNPETGNRLPGEVRFLHQDCSLPWPLESGTLDVVFTSNFLEHLPNKQSVEETVSQAYRCLRGGGSFICMGPNIRYLPGSYWDYWDHQIPLTDHSCAELLRSIGFTVERSMARFLPYSMSRGNRPPLFLVDLYLRLPVLWPLFGRQFLIIARKPAAISGAAP